MSKKMLDSRETCKWDKKNKGSSKLVPMKNIFQCRSRGTEWSYNRGEHQEQYVFGGILRCQT